MNVSLFVNVGASLFLSSLREVVRIAYPEAFVVAGVGSFLSNIEKREEERHKLDLLMYKNSLSEENALEHERVVCIEFGLCRCANNLELTCK